MEVNTLLTDLLILAPTPRSPSTVSSELAPSIRGTILVKLSRCILFLDVRALCTLSPEETIRLYREKPSEEHQVS